MMVNPDRLDLKEYHKAAPAHVEDRSVVTLTPIEVAALAAWKSHEWQRGRFTGTVTCARCGLLPLDEDDYLVPCAGLKPWDLENVDCRQRLDKEDGDDA